MYKIELSTNNFRVVLNPSKPLFPGHFIPPVNWNGKINGEAVSIIQLSHSAKQESDFKFEIYSDKFSEIKLEVIKAIDEKLRIMD